MKRIIIAVLIPATAMPLLITPENAGQAADGKLFSEDLISPDSYQF